MNATTKIGACRRSERRMVVTLAAAVLTAWTVHGGELLAAENAEPAAPGAGDASAQAPADLLGRSPIDGVVGHVGFGYFTGTAPLGVRYWLTRNNAIDVGVDIAFASGGIESHRYALEAGYVLALAHYHYSVVFARAGLGARYRNSGEAVGSGQWDLNGNAFLGAELFLGAFGFPNISLQGGYGLQGNYTLQGGSVFVLSAVNADLNVVGSGTVGFHIYW